MALVGASDRNPLFEVTAALPARQALVPIVGWFGIPTSQKVPAAIRKGNDPIKERERLHREASKSDHSLRVIAEEATEARKAELKNDGKAGRWFSPLALHVLPKLGDRQEMHQSRLVRRYPPVKAT
jgi:hypothetical protein